MSALNLYTDRRGSVAVEFVIISSVILVFIFFLTDLIMQQATIGRLDRVSYSVAGVMRERIQLYDRREKLTQQDVDQIYKLASRMLTDMEKDADLSHLGLTIEELHFTENIKSSAKDIELYRSWKSGNSDHCLPPQPLNDLTDLSPKGSYDRWVPLYQVTVCLPTKSWYKKLTTSQGEKPILSSFSIVMAR